MTYRIPLDDILGVEDSITPFDIICFFLLVTFGPYFVYTCYTHDTDHLSAVIWHDAARCLGYITHISAFILHLLFRGVWRTLVACQYAIMSLLWAFRRANSTVASIMSYSKRFYHAVSTLNAVQAENQRLRLDAATNRRNLATVTAEKDLFQQAFEERWSRARLYKVFPHLKPAKWDSDQHCAWACSRLAEKYERMMRKEKAKAKRANDEARRREQALLVKLEQKQPNAKCSQCPKLRKENDDAVAEKTRASATIERLGKELEQYMQGATCFNCATLRRERATAEEESARLRTKLEEAEKPVVCSECPRLRDQIAALELATQRQTQVQEAATQTTQQATTTQDAAMQTTEAVYGADVYAHLQNKVLQAENFARSKQEQLQKGDYDRVYFSAQLKYISGLLKKKTEDPTKMEAIENKSKLAGNDAVAGYQREQARRKAEEAAERQRRAQGN